MKLSSVIGCALVLATAVGCAPQDEGGDVEADEHELTVRAEADTKAEIRKLQTIECNVDSFFGRGVALSELPYEALPADYESRSAKDKQTLLWQRMQSTLYPAECRPKVDLGFMSMGLLSMIRGGLSPTWDHTADELPAGRLKVVRPFGSVATIDFVTRADSPWTGVLRPNSTIKGIVRISDAGSEKDGFVPGIAIKFLIDNAPSVNVVAMHSMLAQRYEGRPDHNFFRYDFKNTFPSYAEQSEIDGERSLKMAITQKVFAFAFGRDPNRLEVDHLGVVAPDGTREESPLAPKDIAFRPAAGLENAWEQMGVGDLRDALLRIPSGSKLYDVYGLDGGREALIGSIVLSSPIVPSAWADYRLFFRHRRG